MNIKFENIKLVFDKKIVLENFNLDIDAHQLTSIIGTSGCGKTSVLKLINGLNKPVEGVVYLDDMDLNEYDLIKLRRQIGYVIQDSGLFEHLSIYENIAYVLRLSKVSDELIKERVNELVILLELDVNDLNKYPHQLSGGQQQRVGIARALAAKPKILLMDEPFAAVDAITRKKLQKELIKIQKQLMISVVLVTHDIKEAFLLSDKIIIMNEGKILQYDTSAMIKENPFNEFVEELIAE